MRSDLIKWSDKLLKCLSDSGVSVLIGYEIEFYLRKSGVAPSESDIQCFINSPIKSNIEKEKGLGQFEFAFPHMEAKNIISTISSVRRLIASVSSKGGMDVLFDPKPFSEDYGSSMHFHVSLHDINGDNIFQSNSLFMESIISSVLELVRTDLDFICNDEDLKRLQPRWMAPSHIAWGGNNRTVVIRIPEDKPKYKRFEFRLPSANCDEYKVLLFLLVAILRSKENDILYEKVYGNAYDEQYSLQPLKFCNNIMEKKFIDKDSVDNFIARLCQTWDCNI